MEGEVIIMYKSVYEECLTYRKELITLNENNESGFRRLIKMLFL